MKVEVAPGVVLWPGRLSRAEQESLVRDVLLRIAQAPFYRAEMLGSGKPLSVEMSNFGSLGWFTDAKKGYRYESLHPITGAPWPEIPPSLLALWDETTAYGAAPEACLVNLYRAGARMGLHRDSDEEAADAPVLSVSLGDAALFRIGGASRSDATRSLTLSSGDVLMFGGPARFAFHGVDRVLSGSSMLIPGGGRINLTMRRVLAKSVPSDAATPQPKKRCPVRGTGHQIAP